MALVFSDRNRINRRPQGHYPRLYLGFQSCHSALSEQWVGANFGKKNFDTGVSVAFGSLGLVPLGKRGDRMQLQLFEFRSIIIQSEIEPEAFISFAGTNSFPLEKPERGLIRHIPPLFAHYLRRKPAIYSTLWSRAYANRTPLAHLTSE